METGKHLNHNLAKLESVTDQQLLKALAKCRDHVKTRLRKRTLFGAHNQERLGMDPLDFYVNFAYDVLANGKWEWKEGRTLGQQLVRIANNQIGKQVEKFTTEKDNHFSMAGEHIDSFFYAEDPPAGEPTGIQELLYSHQIEIIEKAIKGDQDLEIFWECIKEKMKPKDITAVMEKTTNQIGKLREKLIKKTKDFL